MPSLTLRRSPGGSRVSALRGWLTTAAACSTVLVTGATWLLGHPGRNPLSEPDTVLVRHALGTTATTWLSLVLGVVGVLAAAYGLARPTGRATAATLVAVGIVEVVGVGVLLQSITSIALAGYLVALALPLGLAWIAVQVIRRYRRLRWVLAVALLGLAVWGAATEVLAPTHVVRLAAEVGAGFARSAPTLALAVVTAAVALTWTLVLVRLLAATRPVQALGDWVLRHRTGVTIVAAAGPVPYGLIRASWLTPWPLLSPSGEVLPPEIRLWGLLLGGGAVLGAVLTIGLIRPWGVVFPRWMPRWAGRPVPERAATVPGGLVAGILCLSAAPMLVGILLPAPGTIFGDVSLAARLASTLIFPFWLWGPALALAVWGYARYRRALAR
jgi:hypothetical protein